MKRPTLRPSISGTQCDRDKPILSAERGVQSDCVTVLNTNQIGLKIPETGVITAEAHYHAQIWEDPQCNALLFVTCTCDWFTTAYLACNNITFYFTYHEATFPYKMCYTMCLYFLGLKTFPLKMLVILNCLFTTSGPGNMKLLHKRIDYQGSCCIDNMDA